MALLYHLELVAVAVGDLARVHVREYLRHVVEVGQDRPDLVDVCRHRQLRADHEGVAIPLDIDGDVPAGGLRGMGRYRRRDEGDRSDQCQNKFHHGVVVPEAVV